MTTNYYVNYEDGNDSWDGTTPEYQPSPEHGPKKHLSAAVVLVADPLTEETIIHLAGEVVTPQDYTLDEVDEKIELSGLHINTAEGGRLIIQPGIWNDEDYSDGIDPLVHEKEMTICASKPCIVPRFELGDVRGVVLRGLEIIAVGGDNDFDSAIQVENANRVLVQFCSVIDFQVGILIENQSYARIENCYFGNCQFGLFALNGSTIDLVGGTVIENSLRNGILCFNHSLLNIVDYFGEKYNYYTTLINTTLDRQNYAAIKAMVGSSILIGEARQLVINMNNYPTVVRILNETNFAQEDYFGVVLETGSEITGAENLTFSKIGINNSNPTVLPDNRVVQK